MLPILFLSYHHLATISLIWWFTAGRQWSQTSGKHVFCILFLTARPKFPTLPELPVQASTCQSQPALPGIKNCMIQAFYSQIRQNWGLWELWPVHASATRSWGSGALEALSKSSDSQVIPRSKQMWIHNVNCVLFHEYLLSKIVLQVKKILSRCRYKFFTLDLLLTCWKWLLSFVNLIVCANVNIVWLTMLMIASPDVYVIKIVINMALIYSLYPIVCGGAGYW